MSGRRPERKVKPHTEARVLSLPQCDFCTKSGTYDARTFDGRWAFMCQAHFEEHGIGLGLGKGQRLVLKVEEYLK